MNYYNIYNQNNATAAFARGEVELQLNLLEDTYRKLSSFIKQYDNSEDQARMQTFLAQMFLGGSYEVIRSFLGKSRIKQMRERNNTFEFFYFCRNASFHGNKFNFTIMPKNAIWNTHKITPLDQGHDLFPSRLSPSEISLLLKDIIKLF